MMNCVEIQGLFSAYLDHECTPEENEFVNTHIASCPTCLEQFELTKALVEKLNSFDEQDLPEGFHDELMHKIHELSPAKKYSFAKMSRSASAVAAAFLLCVVFGLIGTGLLSNISNKKESTDQQEFIKYESAVTEADPESTYAAASQEDEAPMLAMDSVATEASDTENTNDLTDTSEASIMAVPEDAQTSNQDEASASKTNEAEERTGISVDPSAQKSISLSEELQSQDQQQVAFGAVKEVEVKHSNLAVVIIIVTFITLLIVSSVFLWIRKKH